MENEEKKETFHTQGGGLVEWDEIQKHYVFVECPPGFPNFEVGDFMPDNWGIA